MNDTPAVRICESCGHDITNRPANHTLCLDCWRDMHPPAVEYEMRKVAAWNVDGSGTNKLYRKSWIRFWEEQTGLRRNKCSYQGCSRRGEHGGHLWLKGLGVAIAPICRRCNHPHNTARWQGGGSFLAAGSAVVHMRMTRTMITAPRKIAVRLCESCRHDISDRPANHTLCLDCWRGMHSPRHLQDFFDAVGHAPAPAKKNRAG